MEEALEAGVENGRKICLEGERESEHSRLFSHGGSQEASGLRCHFLTVVCGFRGERNREAAVNHTIHLLTSFPAALLFCKSLMVLPQGKTLPLLSVSQREGHVLAEQRLNIAPPFGQKAVQAVAQLLWHEVCSSSGS